MTFRNSLNFGILHVSFGAYAYWLWKNFINLPHTLNSAKTQRCLLFEVVDDFNIKFAFYVIVIYK